MAIHTVSAPLITTAAHEASCGERSKTAMAGHLCRGGDRD
jgi:hypothetical protein